MIKIEASMHVEAASDNLQFWKQYIRDYKRKGKSDAPQQLTKVQAKLNKNFNDIYKS